MSDIKLGALKIPLADYAIQGNALLGIKESGKTYTAMMIAEQLLDNNLPFIAFDWIGVWKNIKRPGKGKGYPVVVAGGRDGDLPLSPASTPEIIRAAMRENIPLVVDLYSRDLTKADRRRIMQSAIEILLDENEEHGMRHLFFEEAAEAAPQRIGADQAKLYSAIESLARMGGNALLGYTLINQRAEEVNKAVLEICDCLILMRQRGKNSLLSLSKWLTAGAVEDEKAISSTLATLPTGEAWVWTRDNAQPVRVKMQEKNSFHPNRKDTARRPLKSKAAVDVSSFVARLGAAIPQIVEQKKQNDPAELRKQISQLQRELSGAAKSQAAPEKVIERVEVPVVDEALLAQLRSWGFEIRKEGEGLIRLADGLTALEARHRKLATQVQAPALRTSQREVPTAPARSVMPSPPVSAGDPGLKIGPGERATLRVLGMFPHGLERHKITTMTGYKKSSRDTYISRLKDLGFAEYETGGKVRITDAGMANLGSDFEPLPTGRALQDYWLDKLTDGQRPVLEVLINAYPDPVDRNAISDATGFTKSSRDTYISRPAARELVTTPAKGVVRASDTLFE